MAMQERQEAPSAYPKQIPGPKGTVTQASIDESAFTITQFHFIYSSTHIILYYRLQNETFVYNMPHFCISVTYHHLKLWFGFKNV